MGSATACQSICQSNHQINRNKYSCAQICYRQNPSQLIQYQGKLQPMLFDDPDDLINLQFETKDKQTKQPIQNNIDNIQYNKQENKQNLVIVNYYQGSDNTFRTGLEQFNPIIVPASVIKLSLPQKTIKKINQFNANFLDKLYDKNYPSSQNWKLLGQGCYANILKENFGVFIQNNQYYQGQFLQNMTSNSFIPHGIGLYATQNSIFQGNLNQGKAHGKGKYISNDIKYQGIWENGQFKDGSIYHPKYTYVGQLKNKLPHGQGKIIFNQSNTTYQGIFLYGKFQDKQGTYDCVQYIYKGGFKKGRKHGTGSLKQKQNLSRIPLFLKGQWIEDKFQGQIK